MLEKRPGGLEGKRRGGGGGGWGGALWKFLVDFNLLAKSNSENARADEDNQQAAEQHQNNSKQQAGF